MPFDAELDARGLLCPIPILKTRFALDELSSGEVLKVLSTDAGSTRDMEAFARQTGHELLASGVNDDVYVFYLRKA
ncbi:MAG TPA: sulfurtransferase TusA family protein [Gemmatimonadota bacterium]|nr:sulfurtransferase TusA family protein [Gemmatimonadota bacterium]